MPHLRVEYSPNVAARVDMARFCRALASAAQQTGIFPAAGIRVRAFACTHLAMAGKDPRTGFIDIEARIGRGRTLAGRRAALQHIFAAARKQTRELMQSTPFMLSMELREIEPQMSQRVSSIRMFLEGSRKNG